MWNTKKIWQDQIRWDQLIKYKMINWREQKSDEVKYKWSKKEKEQRWDQVGARVMCATTNAKIANCAAIFLWEALLSEESTFLLPKVIKYQRIRTFHNKGYYTQTLNWIIDFISHGMVSTFPRCLAQIPRHLLTTSMTMTMPMKTPSALSFNWEAMI